MKHLINAVKSGNLFINIGAEQFLKASHIRIFAERAIISSGPFFVDVTSASVGKSIRFPGYVAPVFDEADFPA